MLNFKKYSLSLKVFGVFLVYSSIFFILHYFKTGFFGADPYYHAKHSLLIAQSGTFNFVQPWLNFHFLNFAPCDPWWAHHLITAAFMKFFDPFISLKAVSAVLVGAIFAVFYYLLSHWQVKRAFLWTFLYFSSSFLFLTRLILERPFLFVIAALPLIYFFAYKRKYLCLFILAVLYALLYNLIFYPIFIIMMAAIIEYFVTKNLNIKPTIVISAGILAGVLLHPDTMNYLYVAVIHSFAVLYYKFTGVYLGLGGEIHPLSFSNFLRDNIIMISIYMVSIAIFLNVQESFSNKKRNLLWQTFLISFFWFIVALLVPRAVEYWFPFAWIFIAVFWNSFILSSDYLLMKDSLKKAANLKILTFFVLSIWFLFIFYNFAGIAEELIIKNRHNPDTSFEEVNKWLIANTKENETVFYTDWSFWPRMFFYNDHNRYVHGMDPTFLYEYDQDLALLWLGISYKGEACLYPCEHTDKPKKSNEAEVIKNLFKSRFILIKNEKNKEYNKIYSNTDLFALRFENKDLKIYEIKP